MQNPQCIQRWELGDSGTVTMGAYCHCSQHVDQVH